MLYLEVITDGPDDTVGKGVYTITENVLDTAGSLAIVHEKEHSKQNIEPTFSQYYKGKSGWYKELDAVKKEAEWYAKLHNATEEQKLQWFKARIVAYKGSYPKEFAEFVSRNYSDI